MRLYGGNVAFWFVVVRFALLEEGLCGFLVRGSCFSGLDCCVGRAVTAVGEFLACYILSGVGFVEFVLLVVLCF